MTRSGNSNNPADSSMTSSAPQITKLEREHGSIMKLKEPLDETNWAIWREQVRRIFKLCRVVPYIDGTLPRPNAATTHQDILDAWDSNDIYAQILITNNISGNQMVHVSRLETAHQIYSSLEAIHETRGHQVAISIQRSLFRMSAQEDDDIVERLTKLKKQWERLNVLDDEDFRITDTQFKTIIASSLPKSWDIFTDPYVGRRKGTVETDPKKLTSSQEFIGIIEEEYIRRKARNEDEPRVGNQTYYSQPTNLYNQQPLVDRVRPSTSKDVLCHNCGHKTHVTDNCKWLGQPKCTKCGWFGHIALNCRRLTGSKRKDDKGGNKPFPPKKSKREQAHPVTLVNANDSMDTEIVLSAEEQAGACNFDTYDQSTTENDERLLFYDWLADSATTSHVVNMRDAFTSFQSLQNTLVNGVGSATTHAHGRGTVEIESEVDGYKYILKLEDVLYIPSNPQNLLSLGRWDNAGGTYRGGNNALSLITKDGRKVATGTKINNNLYKMNKFTIRKPGSTHPTNVTANPQSFNVGEPAKDWEVWHRCFGHIGMSSLQKILDRNLVKGLNIDTRTPKYDCEACTQAKQSQQPFPKEENKIPTEPGELTHSDLWGKYPIRSIHGNQYYISFLDDSTRRARIRFLKRKDEATQAVKDYITNLTAQGKRPRALRIDRGKEFVNNDLLNWCQQQGIEIQLTAPYSPSQNGAAERLNRTLIELARAMMAAQKVPEFLWEYAVAHAAYVRERAPTKFLQQKTPYEAWHNEKPNVSHLREFGTPVWILLQGQKEQRKILPKSKRHLFMGFDDGSKSVKYYNAETCNVLTSRNFRFLTNLPAKEPTPEPIIINPTPVIQREGESGNNTLQPGRQHMK